MKKGFLVAAMAAILLVQGNALPTQNLSAAPGVDAAQRRLTYNWYSDPGFLSYTGEYSTINEELTRLRNLYSGYIFSASPGSGLYAFEWGYLPGYRNGCHLQQFLSDQ